MTSLDNTPAPQSRPGPMSTPTVRRMVAGSGGKTSVNQADMTKTYADKPAIYPRDVKGTFRTLKWTVLWVLLGIYHVVPWLRWDRGPDAPNQAILMDLDGRRGYLLGIEIWPQEVYYFTGLLILGAIGLFFVTALFGRVWCGFTCPQTVWSDLFFWIERQIEGDRNQRLRLDSASWSVEKIVKKGIKHAVWLIVAFLMSFAWIWYFNDAPSVTVDIFRGAAGPWVYAFLAGLTTTTYLLAGWAREQVCFYMCPWPRFQGAMFDEDTLLVTYEEWRGEPRAKRPVDGKFEGRGHCVDCYACVQVCPTGIDIRDGQQMQCIGCALCIDACDSVMTRLGLPTRLITYDSIDNQLARAKNKGTDIRLIRPRTIAYAAILTLVLAVMTVSLLTRSRLEVNIQRDRAPIFVQLSNGDIRNGYTFKVLNMEARPHSYKLTVRGLDAAVLTVIGIEEKGAAEVPLSVDADAVTTYRVFVKVPPIHLRASSLDMEFVLVDTETGKEKRAASVFLGPGN